MMAPCASCGWPSSTQQNHCGCHCVVGVAGSALLFDCCCCCLTAAVCGLQAAAANGDDADDAAEGGRKGRHRPKHQQQHHQHQHQQQGQQPGVGVECSEGGDDSTDEGDQEVYLSPIHEGDEGEGDEEGVDCECRRIDQEQLSFNVGFFNAKVRS